MKCRVFAVSRNGKPNKEIGNEVSMSGRGATAMRDGEIVARLQHVTIDSISFNGIAIDGFVPTRNDKWLLQRWWCAVGEEKP